eukprot:3807829-Amphidinium_carterae.1
MAFVALLEAELHQRCHEDIGMRRNQPPAAQAMTMPNGMKPLCRNFTTDAGCEAEEKCPLYHPKAHASRCFNCG